MAKPFYKRIYDSVRRQVRAEPRKALVLSALGTTVAVLWTRLMFFGVSAPSAASGAVAGGVNAELPATGAARAMAEHPGLRALEEWGQGPIAPTAKNVFALKLEYFPKDGSKVLVTPENVGESFWDELAKSLAFKADQEKARRILVENLQAEAAKLDLQSIVMGNGPSKAVIDGTLLAEGEMVKSFKVIRIEAKRVIVEREGVRLEVGFGF